MKNLNKKGFTLVELLAVIVILALIMAIAIYSISGIMQNSREGVFKDTAISIIKGVRTQLMSVNSQEEGTYFFRKTLLENDNDLPFGGKINYGVLESSVIKQKESDTTGFAVEPVASSSGNTPIYKYNNTTMLTACTKTSVSYVNVTYNTTTGGYEYSICLTSTDNTSSGARYIKGTEAELLGNSTQTIFQS